MFDIQEIKDAVPKQHRSKIDNEMINDINRLIENPEYGDIYTRNAVTYASVLHDGRFKLKDYFNAVAFITHKMLGCDNLPAYKKVFPHKYARLVARNTSNKDMHSYASAYNKNKLVTLIYQQTLIPDHIVFTSIRHRAIKAQAALLDHDNPHIVQKAADSLMNHLKAPVDTQMTIDITSKEGGLITELTGILNNISKQQRSLIIDGSMNAKEIAHSKLVSNGEIIDV